MGFNFKGFGSPPADYDKVDRTAEIGNILTDVAGLTGGRAGGIMGLIGSATSVASEMRDGDVFAGASNIGQMALNTMQIMKPELAESSKFGVASGLLQAGGYGAEAAHHRDQVDSGYRNNEFWGNAGWSALGALNAAGVPGLGKATLGLDLAGMAAGMMNKNWRFDAGQVLGMGGHAMFDTARVAGHGIAHAVGDHGGGVHVGVGGHGGHGHGGHGHHGGHATHRGPHGTHHPR